MNISFKKRIYSKLVKRQGRKA